MKKGTGPFFIFSGGETSFPKILTPIACRYILSLNESADTMKEASDKASVTIEELKQISEEVKNAISVIADQTNQTNTSAQNIQSATQFISEIAAQTNLLSLNASIEAARAGEAGRGFAVVATEIQKLAEQSDTASGNIAEIVNTLIANSEKVVETMERTRTVIDQQNQYIENTSSAVSGVITELDASVERIRSIEQKTTELEKARNEIIAIIETLSDIAQQNADGTSQTNTAMSEMADSFRNIENSTENLRNTADMLAQNISNFHI
jgi:methyl-accepting chemotaxis protein